MKKSTVIAIPYSYIVITAIVYALLDPMFFEMDNVFGGENFVVDEDNDNKMITYTQQVVGTKCKSPCPPTAEMCIEMCA